MADFIPVNTNFENWAEVQPLYEHLYGRDLSSAAALESFLLDWGKLTDCLKDCRLRLDIAINCDTESKEKEDRNRAFLRTVSPQRKTWHQKLQQKFIESPALGKLPAERYGLLIRIIQNGLKLFREENLPLEVEESILVQEYQKICGRMLLKYQGQGYILNSLAALSRFLSYLPPQDCSSYFQKN
jgi:oligoendopeptidase F